MSRLIAIGDVHGCYAELEKLLEHLNVTENDQLLFVGDLVNRGPDSKRVIQIARHYKAISLLGNHEWRLLSWYRLRDDNILKHYDWTTIEMLDEDDWYYLAHMPLWHYEKQHETVFVHGGFLPNQSWRTQTVSVVTEIQVITPDGQAARRSQSPESPIWADSWKGPPFVVYGHIPRSEIARSPWALGLDTGCVFGGHLSAYILPERKIVQVKARRTYVQKKL